ncbi:MAG: ribonuclease HIII [Candidatus Zixiibacteriota bacterium]|nr:MAG: ribonuclease HIII [candidate division Zixibacteria bacterium]
MSQSLKIIGVDESGKGDFFGPLVISSFIAENSEIPQLKAYGVKDGKLLSEKRIIEIDKFLRDNFNYVTVTIMPDEYNKRYKEIKNLNKLLAWGHARCISLLNEKQECDKAISDKFGKIDHISGELKKLGQSIKLKQIVRGEAVTQVAAASIIARAEFLRQMEYLSDKYDYQIPRGASAKVDQAGQELVQLHGEQILKLISKTHFKNYNRVLSPTLL